MTIDDIKKIVRKRNWKYSHILSSEFQDFINLFPNAILISRSDGKIIQCNPEAQEIFGYSRDEFLNQLSIEDLVPDKYKKNHPNKRKEFFETLCPRVIGNRSVDLFALRKSGETFPMDASLIPLVSTEGNLALSVITDLTYVKSLQAKLEKSNAELEKIALLDPLTSIPNRRCFDNVLDRRCSEAKRHTFDLSLLYIDLDKFKPINDNYGHDVGDELLIKVVKRFHSVLRNEDFLARRGGDEFCVILSHTSNEMAFEVAKKIVKAMEKVFTIKEQPINISVSVGICTFCDKNCTPEKITKYADKAMYIAKRSGGNRISNCSGYIKRLENNKSRQKNEG